MMVSDSDYIKIQGELATFVYFCHNLLVGRQTADLTEDENALFNMMYAKGYVSLTGSHNYIITRNNEGKQMSPSGRKMWSAFD